MSRPAAAALVAAGRPQDPAELARDLARGGRAAEGTGDGGPSIDRWAELIASLCSRDLLIDDAVADTDPRLSWLVTLRRNWSRYGWHEAAEYHALSFDYPCIDYTQATAFFDDQDRMRGYQSQEPDTDRFKLGHVEKTGVDLPDPASDAIDATARQVWKEEQLPKDIDFDALAKVLSMAFGPTGAIVPRTNSAPLLRRSSPSGGGRHPSEGYVVIRDVPGVAPGWYHITMQPFSLRKIEGLPLDDESLRRLFPNTVQRFPLDIKALVIITTVFERNMYRYREARTFRTVHMDAGHIAGTLRIAAKALGLTAAVFYCDAATDIEKTLGIDGMEEGYMLTVAVTDGNRGAELLIPARARQAEEAAR